MLAASALLWLGGCTIDTDRSASGEKKVDVRTPFGDIKVNTDVDARDTGLPVYPGAKPAPSTEEDKHAANVNISSGPFALKVVAVKFRSDDSPDKVLEFYRPKMKQFGGQFLECKQSEFFGYSRNSKEDKELKCDGGGHGTSVELKAGVPERQHIVAVKPYGTGSEFALVYVATRGKDSEL